MKGLGRLFWFFEALSNIEISFVDFNIDFFKADVNQKVGDCEADE